jgi:hypothetical protein
MSNRRNAPLADPFRLAAPHPDDFRGADNIREFVVSLGMRKGPWGQGGQRGGSLRRRDAIGFQTPNVVHERSMVEVRAGYTKKTTASARTT